MAGRLARLLRRRPPVEAVVLADDGSLVRVGIAFDAARADSAVLAEMQAAGVDLSAPVLLRHHLLLPDEAAVEQARRLLAQDGYGLVAEPAESRGFSARPSRTQVLTALSAAQERSRMAGLAQRLGGDVEGWDALAPKAAPPGGSDVDAGQGDV